MAQGTQQFEADQNERDRQTQIQVATIQAESRNMGGEDSDQDGQSDLFEAFDRQDEEEIIADRDRERQGADLKFKREQLKQKDKIDEAKLVIDRKKAARSTATAK